MSAEIIARTSAAPLTFTEDQSQMIRDAYANGATDGEFAVLMEIAKARRLNPLLKQVHFVKRWDKDKARMVWATQVSIDGLRAIAERTGIYAGQDEPEFTEGPSGVPTVCKVRVYRKDWTRPAVGVAYFGEYVQTTKDGKVTSFWQRMPHTMLAKCAESLALRKAFPEDTSGLYTPEEMGQAENVEVQQHAPYLAPGTPPAAALPAPPTWADDLARCATLRDVRTCYQSAASAERDNRAQCDDVRAWCADRGIVATAAEVTAILSTLPDAALVLLDDVHADEEHETTVRIERVARRVARERSAWDAHSADTTSKIVARSYAHAAGIDLKAAGAALKRAIENGDTDPEPPTGTDGPAREPGSDDGDDAAAAAYEAHRAAQGERAQVTELRVVRDESADPCVTSAAAWAAHLATERGTWGVRGAFRKRERAFAAEGVLHDREAATLRRLAELKESDPMGFLYCTTRREREALQRKDKAA
jgi:phage recombination protein Bet